MCLYIYNIYICVCGSICLYLYLLIFKKKTLPFCSLFEDRICCVFLCSAGPFSTSSPSLWSFYWSRIICSTVILPKKNTDFPFTSQKLQCLVSWWFFTNPFAKYATIKNGFMNLPQFSGWKFHINLWGTYPPPRQPWKAWPYPTLSPLARCFFFRFVQLYRHPYMCMPGCIGIGGLVNVSFLSSHQMKSWVNSKEILTKAYKKLVGGFNLGEKYWSNWIISPTITRG